MHNRTFRDLPAPTPKPPTTPPIPPTVTPTGYVEGAWGLPIKATH